MHHRNMHTGLQLCRGHPVQLVNQKHAQRGSLERGDDSDESWHQVHQSESHELTGSGTPRCVGRILPKAEKMSFIFWNSI